MSEPLPKFCVGEEVAVVGITNSMYDIERTEVTYSRYVDSQFETPEGARVSYKGWIYRTAHQRTDGCWFEQSLRKLPPEDENHFETMMDELLERKPHYVKVRNYGFNRN